MKKLLLSTWVFMMVMMVALLACSKDEEDDPETQPQIEQPKTEDPKTETPVQEDVYYVKYEVKFSTNQVTEHFVAVNTEDGDKTMSLGKSRDGSWDGTFGPFKKGFNAYISFRGLADRCELRINVSKNNEMFVLKEYKIASDINSMLTAIYTIK